MAAHLANLGWQRVFAFKVNIASGFTAFAGGVTFFSDNGLTKASSVALTGGHGLGIYLAIRGIVASHNLKILGVGQNSYYLCVASHVATTWGVLEEIKAGVEGEVNGNIKDEGILEVTREGKLLFTVEVLESEAPAVDIHVQALGMLRRHTSDCAVFSGSKSISLISMLDHVVHGERRFSGVTATPERGGVAATPERAPHSPLSPAGMVKMELCEEAIKALLILWREEYGDDFTVTRDEIAKSLGKGVWNKPMNAAIKFLRSDPVLAQHFRSVGRRHSVVAGSPDRSKRRTLAYSTPTR